MHAACRLAVALVIVARLAAPARGECCPGSSLHDGFRTAVAGLEREWIVRLPFNAAGWRLSQVVVGEGLVVGLSSDGGVHAIRAAGLTPGSAAAPAPGTLLWSRHIGRPFSADEPPGVGPLLVALPRDFAVHGLDARTGQTSWREPDVFHATAAATVIDDFVYVPDDSDRVMRYPVSPRTSGTATDPQPAKSTKPAKPADRGKAGRQRLAEKPKISGIGASGRVTQPVQALPDGFGWFTDTGRVVVLQASDTGWARWVLDLGSPLTGPLAVRGRSIFATTVAADLVRIDVGQAVGQGLQTEWVTPLEVQPGAGPFVVNDVVLVPLGDDGIVAYGAEDGLFRWRTPVAGRLIAVTGGRAWCLDSVGRLTAIDPETGLTVARLCLGGFTLPVVNTFSDRLILASPDGLVTSLTARTGGGLSAPGAAGKAPAAAGPAPTPR